MDDIRLFADADGIILRRDVISAGGTDDMLVRLRRSKQIVRVRHGAYCLHDVWVDRSREQRHQVLARLAYEFARTSVVLSHVSAALVHGAPLWDLSLDEVHLTRRDRKAGRREVGVAQHRGLLLEEDVVTIEGRNITSPTRTALDLTTITDLEHALPVVDHFLHQKLVTKPDLYRGVERMSQWANTLGMLLVVNFADGRRESVGEARTAVLLLGTGRPAPEPNYEICDERGNVLWRVDFAWPELGVFLEFDGKVKYTKFLKEGEDITDVVLREKKREERICRRTGWRCIRITWADLYSREATLRYIVSVLDGGPVHP